MALTRVLGNLAVGHGERSFEDPFLHTLVRNYLELILNYLLHGHILCFLIGGLLDTYGR